MKTGSSAGGSLQAQAGCRDRVFSRPENKNWLEGEGLSVADRRSLITDAGQLVPGLAGRNSGSPNSLYIRPLPCRTDDGSYVERNDGCSYFTQRFPPTTQDQGVLRRRHPQEPLSEIVRITRSKNRRNAWSRIL